jgi:hypothetical protein
MINKIVLQINIFALLLSSLFMGHVLMVSGYYNSYGSSYDSYSSYSTYTPPTTPPRHYTNPMDANCGYSGCYNSSYSRLNALDSTCGYVGCYHSHSDDFAETMTQETIGKVVTFCTPSVYNAERCAKYCKRLSNEYGMSHALCDNPGKAVVEKKKKKIIPKIKKEIIKNDNGTTTEIMKKKNKGNDVEIRTTFSIDKNKLFEETITKGTIIGEDGIRLKTEQSEKFIFNEDGAKISFVKFEKKFENDKLRKSIEEKKDFEDENKEIQITTLLFNDDEKLLEKKIEIIQENEDDDTQKIEINQVKNESKNEVIKNKSQIIFHQVFNEKLNDYILKTESSKELSYTTNNKDEIRAVYDLLEEVVIIYDENILESASDGKLKDGLDKLKISLTNENKELILKQKDAIGVNIDANLIIDSSTGQIFVDEIKEENKINNLIDTINQDIQDKDILSDISYVRLFNENGARYEIIGVKKEKVFKIFSLEIKKKIIVNAQNGNINSVENLNNKYLDKISW